MATRRPTTVETLARNARELRRRKGWSQAEAAARSHGAFSQRWLSDVESGSKACSVELADTLGRVLGTTGWRLLSPHLLDDLAQDDDIYSLLDDADQVTLDSVRAVLEAAARRRTP